MKEWLTNAEIELMGLFPALQEHQGHGFVITCQEHVVDGQRSVTQVLLKHQFNTSI